MMVYKGDSIELKPEQSRAVKGLERALKACYDADLWLWGMDRSLIVTNDHQTGIDSPHDISDNTGKNQDLILIVNDHKCYIDSGGW